MIHISLDSVDDSLTLVIQTLANGTTNRPPWDLKPNWSDDHNLPVDIQKKKKKLFCSLL